jgi:hypothetical protein
LTTIKIDTRRIADWKSFHDVFAQALGFPAYYGRNMDAWIDCMTSLDDPGAGMTKVHAKPGGAVTLLLEHVKDFGSRCPDLMAAIEQSTAFVNWRRNEMGQPAVLALAYYSEA